MANASKVELTNSRGFVSYDSILLSHGDVRPRAYVLFHGMSASPRQFVEFARQLHARGANVYVPRLPQHGLEDRLTTALVDLTAQQLQRFALASIERAGDLGRDVHVVGFSLGGLLSAWIGQSLAVARSTSIAPFLGVAGVPRRATARVAEMTLAAPNQFWWWNPLLREQLGPAHGYPRFATHAVAQAARLASELFGRASHEAPAARELAIVINASEMTVSNRSARYLAWLWSREAPERTRLYRMKGLGPSHDIIEPMRSPENLRRVYPPLVDLVGR